MMENKLCRLLPRTLLVILALSTLAIPQQSQRALPLVTAIDVPFYPPLARTAHLQGVVRIKVTTDGQRVTATHVEEGHKLLAAAAEENARTWRFAPHEPITLVVTYRYKIEREWQGDMTNSGVLLRLPSEVEVSTWRWPGTADYAPEKKK
jgi:TonB family protein